MPAHMKKPHTKKAAKIVWNGMRYIIPFKVIEKYKVIDQDDVVKTLNDAFGDLIEKYGEPAVLLKGLRHKEDLSQIEFSKIIGVTQANLSAMENERRPIGKEIAKRIMKHFGVDYRLFL